ncbi:hypothetical protein RND71_018841 [Anisodus tanguticus]|uniref:Transcription factor CBF/NF-Y/archaeal histone domain-containing protein n=1 Tax=Anisodus tanguticus TaxID=243964 RepID=A0AAE1S4Z2_9SOLA|nr:hypothetical protein RND71_018841 [Anisodus tanguticus]
MVDNINILGSKYDRESSNYNSISEDGVLKEQDRLLPIANVGRIMKQILPPNAKISKEAKETMQECVSEFISFVSGEASDKCHNEKRKTLNGDDICWALGSLGFDDYVEPLKRYLQKYRELEGERINQNKGVGLGNNIEDLRERDELPQRGSTISSNNTFYQKWKIGYGDFVRSEINTDTVWVKPSFQDLQSDIFPVTSHSASTTKERIHYSKLTEKSGVGGLMIGDKWMVMGGENDDSFGQALKPWKLRRSTNFCSFHCSSFIYSRHQMVLNAATISQA